MVGVHIFRAPSLFFFVFLSSLHTRMAAFLTGSLVLIVYYLVYCILYYAFIVFCKYLYDIKVLFSPIPISVLGARIRAKGNSQKKPSQASTQGSQIGPLRQER